MAQDTIDFVGHCDLGHKVETQYCAVYKTLKPAVYDTKT